MQTLRKRCLYLFLALFAVALLIPKTADAAAASDRKFVFVGDSYSIVREGVTKPWPELMMEMLGIDSRHALFARKGGYGIAKPDHRFITLVQQLKKDLKVTDVVIIGAIGNDWRCSESLIRKHFKLLDAECRKRFPNARIVYGFCNWRIINDPVQTVIKRRQNLYKQCAISNGWIYLAGIEKILWGHNEYFQSDGHHPTQEAQNLIGKAVVRAYKKYCVSKITLNKKNVVIKSDKSIKLKAKVFPSTAANKKVTWLSSNPNVIQVEKNGTLCVNGKGTCAVVARTNDGNYTAVCNVTVDCEEASKEFGLMPLKYKLLG